MENTKVKQAEALKNVMRQMPYPVTIVTAAVGKEKRGITIGSFTSLSLDPPLISFNLEQKAQMHDLLSKATHFAVHIPEPGQANLCNQFAIPDRSGEEQFQKMDYSRNAYGTPVLKDFLAVIQCRKHTQVPAGDHTIIIGEVLDINQYREDSAVLYLDGNYHTVAK